MVRRWHLNLSVEFCSDIHYLEYERAPSILPPCGGDARQGELRAHRLMGLSFRRQMPIAGYIVDFVCSDHKLIIEVDGSQHGNDSDQLYDNIRTARLEADGWTVLRFWNDEPLKNIDAVCDAIIRTIGVEKFE
jgi:very-short-patch-repair endonuclease